MEISNTSPRKLTEAPWSFCAGFSLSRHCDCVSIVNRNIKLLKKNQHQIKHPLHSLPTYNSFSREKTGDGKTDPKHSGFRTRVGLWRRGSFPSINTAVRLQTEETLWKFSQALLKNPQMQSSRFWLPHSSHGDHHLSMKCWSRVSLTRCSVVSSCFSEGEAEGDAVRLSHPKPKEHHCQSYFFLFHLYTNTLRRNSLRLIVLMMI